MFAYVRRPPAPSAGPTLRSRKGAQGSPPCLRPHQCTQCRSIGVTSMHVVRPCAFCFVCMVRPRGRKCRAITAMCAHVVVECYCESVSGHGPTRSGVASASSHQTHKELHTRSICAVTHGDRERLSSRRGHSRHANSLKLSSLSNLELARLSPATKLVHGAVPTRDHRIPLTITVSTLADLCLYTRQRLMVMRQWACLYSCTRTRTRVISSDRHVRPMATFLTMLHGRRGGWACRRGGHLDIAGDVDCGGHGCGRHGVERRRCLRPSWTARRRK
jgi:hypothetical protein